MNAAMNTPVRRPGALQVLARAHALQRSLANAGWQIRTLEMDLSGPGPKAELVVDRNDGRWIRAHLDGLGRGTIERFHRETRLSMSVQRPGRVPLVNRIDDQFLGRSSYRGAEAWVAGIADYLDANASRPLATLAMRAEWIHLLTRPDPQPVLELGHGHL